MGRTFIQPTKRLRQLGVAKKFGALTDNLKGKRVVIVDDSMVRGNTMGPIVKLLRKAGAAEVGRKLFLSSVLYISLYSIICIYCHRISNGSNDLSKYVSYHDKLTTTTATLLLNTVIYFRFIYVLPLHH